MLGELREKLRDCAGDSEALEKKLKEVEIQKVAKDGERAALFRLFRKGSISEGNLEAQMAEMVAEKKARTVALDSPARLFIKSSLESLGTSM